ncbi:hypothetical protein G6F57_019558 [Rhizopus arrhizus]|nr:hypothetical protein G6F57_019558 [Rhizopus arrhizus]
MDLLEIFKALSNRTRLDIVKGLKDPAKNFPPQDEGDVHTVGVCVSSIQEGVGLSQSTVSDYLATLQRAGLVEAKRIGQWTYYKRNEATIRALAQVIGKELIAMKAITLNSFGGPDAFELRDLSTPVPHTGQVLVRVQATSINPLDYQALSKPSGLV